MAAADPIPSFFPSIHTRGGASPRFLLVSFLALILSSPIGGAEAGELQQVYSDDKSPNVFPPLVELGSFGAGEDQLNGPSSVAVGPGDRVIVADSFNHRVQVFSLQGKPLARWGSLGYGPAEFLFPTGVAAGSDGEVFVADTGNDRIQVFDAQGKFLRQWGRRGAASGAFQSPVALALSADSVCVAERESHRVQIFSRNGELRASFGGFGDAPGRFKEPLGIAVDGEGRIFVADSGNNRIQTFDARGTLLESWGKWGPHPGFFSCPAGLAWHDGRLYVADSGNHRVQVFDRSGAFLSQWGRHPNKPHEGKGRLHFPAGIAVNSTGGFTIVGESLEHRLQIFANGSARALKRVNDLPWWDDLHARAHGLMPNPPPYTGPSIWDLNPPSFCPVLEQDAHSLLCADLARRPPCFLGRTGGYGKKLGEFNGPGRVALDPSSRQMWVTDRLNRRIQLVELPRDDRSYTGFAATPRILAAFEPALLVPASVQDFDAARSTIDAVALHPAGNLLVVDGGNGLLLLFDRKPAFLNALRPAAPASGRRPRLVDAAVSPDGRKIHVLDRDNFRVVTLDEAGKELAAWGHAGMQGEGAFQAPAGIGTDSEGFVYVTDQAQHRVKKFDSSGRQVLEWGGLGYDPLHLCAPGAIRFVPPDFIVVDDVGNHRAQLFTRQGKPLDAFTKGGSSGPVPQK
jgi:DNA-binding beta-propeller fold protein YncE